MRNLLYFLIKHSPWFVYIFYAIISLILLFRFNPYQQSIFLSSSNVVAGHVFSLSGNVTGYFNLKEINQNLQVKNGELQQELIYLKAQIKKATGDSLQKQTPLDSSLINYNFKIARVINNSISHTQNYITLDKGSKDGIKTEMGVVDQNGIVGIINVVSEHYSVAISLLNPKFRLSCKVKGSDYFGSLVWDGKDPRYAILEELPRHVKFSKGDTVITSGYSAVFPEGIMVGTVQEFSKQKNDNFYALKIKLLTDFCRLNDVRILENRGLQEQKRIEQKAIQDGQ